MAYDVRTNSGFSLLEVTMGIVLLAIASMAVVQLSSQFNFFWKTDRKAKGDQVLAYTGGALQLTDYDSLVALCTAKSAFSSTPISGNCLVGGQLNPAAVASGFVLPSALEIRRDYEGNAAPAGEVCVELTQCALMAQGRALQMSLIGYWPRPGSNDTFVQRTLVIRRTRW